MMDNSVKIRFEAALAGLLAQYGENGAPLDEVVTVASRYAEPTTVAKDGLPQVSLAEFCSRRNRRVQYVLNLTEKDGRVTAFSFREDSSVPGTAAYTGD